MRRGPGGNAGGKWGLAPETLKGRGAATDRLRRGRSLLLLFWGKRGFSAGLRGVGDNGELKGRGFGGVKGCMGGEEPGGGAAERASRPYPYPAYLLRLAVGGRYPCP